MLLAAKYLLSMLIQSRAAKYFQRPQQTKRYSITTVIVNYDFMNLQTEQHTGKIGADQLRIYIGITYFKSNILKAF